ncbi:MAG: DUF4190 domain-containing protein [Phycisphaerae bacterium]
MAGETYFVRSRGKITGPYDVAGLQRLVKLGMLSRVHEVSTDKLNWASAATVPGVLPESAARSAAVYQPEPAETPSNTYEVTEPPRPSDPPAARTESAPPPPAPNGPMVACGSCGSVLPAAQLFNDRGRYICPSCYQRLVPSAPPVRPYPADGGQSKSYHGYGVASLILGLAGLLLPLVGPICAILAIVFGSVALHGNDRIGSREGNGMARAGKIMGIIVVSAYVILLIFWVGIVILIAAGAHHTH